MIAFVLAPLLATNSMSIPFVYREKWLFFTILAYFQLGLLSGYLLVRVVPSGFWNRLPKRERWGAVGGLVIGPLLLSYLLLLLFPLVGNSLAVEVVDRSFTYVSSKPYAGTSRGLVQLELLDSGGASHWVVFTKERAEKLAMKCGDILVARGRNSFIGYVIDGEAKTRESAEPCLRDRQP